MHASFGTDRPALVLDGAWKFRGWEKPGGRDTLFYRESVDDTAWRTMPVPGMWELNGFGDPVYVTSKYPWKWHYENNPPFVPEENNHVGQYRRTFYWDGTEADEQVTLRIGAVTSNGNNSFQNCSALGAVKLPSQLTELGVNLFNGCALEVIDIPGKVEKIGNKALANNKKLKVLDLPESVLLLDTNAFLYDDALETIIVRRYKEGDTSPITVMNGKGVIQGCTSLKHIYVPENAVDAYKAADGWSSKADIIEAAVPSSQ